MNRPVDELLVTHRMMHSFITGQKRDLATVSRVFHTIYTTTTTTVFKFKPISFRNYLYIK